MATTTYTVSAKRDHIENQAKAKTPILAIAELIWNSFDADATRVEVSLQRNQLDEIESIEVADDGAGIDPLIANDAFRSLGGSWKRNSPRTAGNRSMHGKLGKGRFKAFALGRQVVWQTVAQSGAARVRYTIKIASMTIDKVEISEPVVVANSKVQTGTVTRIEGIERNFPTLERDKAAEDLARIFALYLMEYPQISLVYDGERIVPSAVIRRTDDLTLGKVE